MKAKASFLNSISDMAHGFTPCLDHLHIPRHPFDPDGPVISSGIPIIQIWPSGSILQILWMPLLEGAVMIWDDACEVQYDPDREARKTYNELIGV